MVLAHVDLPDDEELLEVVEVGVATFRAALAHQSPDLLADFLAFARRRLTALGGRSVSADQVRALPRMVCEGRVPPADLVTLEALLDRALAAPADRPGDRALRLGAMARSYLDHALAGRQDDAVAVVVDAARAGTDLSVILTEVLEPAQVEIGRLWEEGAVTVAQEHYCTAITQRAMVALYPVLFAPAAGPVLSQRRPRLVAVQAGGSLHEVGLRMVADLLEHEGWETTYLGAVGGPQPVVESLVAQAAQVLAISASMPAHVSDVAAIVAAVRDDTRTRDVKVVVGGRAFVVAPRLAATVGADGVSRDAREAVALCARLVRGDDAAV